MAYYDVPIDLPGRDPMQPPLSYAYNHPLVEPGKRCIVFTHDISPARMRVVHEWEKKQKIPKGSPEELKARGALSKPHPIVLLLIMSSPFPRTFSRSRGRSYICARAVEHQPSR